MTRVRVGLRLKFVKLPNIDGERVFRDVLSFADPDDRSYDDLRAIVESKISFMELPLSEFTVFYTEEKTGDRLVVDNPFFNALLRQWSRQAAKARAQKAEAVSVSLPPQQPRQQHRAMLALLGESAPQYGTALGNALDSSAAEVFNTTESSGNSSSDDDDDGRLPDMMECFDVELISKPSSAFAPPPSRASMMDLPPAPNLVRTGVSHGIAGPLQAPLPATPSTMQLAALTRENLARLCEAESSEKKRSTRISLTGVVSPSTPNAAPAVMNTPSSPSDPQAEVHERVQDLTCPPTHVRFFLRCVILAIRFKTPKPGMTVAELDLGDAEDVTQAITAVTFDEVVHKAIRDHLRGDRRQVLELRQVYVRRKNEADLRYQANPHPLLLRLDRSSKLEVVRMLATPAPQPGSAAVITVREQLGSAGVVDVTQLMGLQQQQRSLVRAGGAPSSENGFSFTAGGGGGAFPLAMSSSSSSSGPRRTTFTMSSGNAGSSTALVSGVVPSGFGQELRARQEMLLRQKKPQDAIPYEPGVPTVTARDVRLREPLVEQHANREEQRKQRIRRKTEVSTQCLLCGLDGSDEQTCMAVVRQQLTKSSRNRGTQIPTFEQVKRDLGDRRRVASGKAPTRLLCVHTFVNSATRTVHVVHPRCAHLCTAYQNGSELEDIVECDLSMNVCALCGMPGACVACYHPQCSEMYHVVCALYSGGYVNFGQRDPFLPCPACPRHTQVQISKMRKGDGGNVLHVDHSCWDEGVAFDSRVVDSTDLRDPDENDGL